MYVLHFADLVSAYSIVNKTLQQLNSKLWQWFLVGVDNEHWTNLDVKLPAVRGEAVIGECWKSSHQTESQHTSHIPTSEIQWVYPAKNVLQ